jgi:hypothetical protein
MLLRSLRLHTEKKKKLFEKTGIRGGYWGGQIKFPFPRGYFFSPGPLVGSSTSRDLHIICTDIRMYNDCYWTLWPGSCREGSLSFLTYRYAAASCGLKMHARHEYLQRRCMAVLNVWHRLSLHMVRGVKNDAVIDCDPCVIYSSWRAQCHHAHCSLVAHVKATRDYAFPGPALEVKEIQSFWDIACSNIRDLASRQFILFLLDQFRSSLT